MSGTFDPYHRWLGIPAKDQPPNHYRLLGLEAFEPDAEVIRDAAERQMAHVRTYQLGQYVELSQRILNELAVAKACLLDAAQKAAYDAAMRRRAQRPTKAPALSDKIYAVMPATSTVKLPAASRPSDRAGLTGPPIERRFRAVASQEDHIGTLGYQLKADGAKLEDANLPRVLHDITSRSAIGQATQPKRSLITSGGIATVVILAFGIILSFNGYRKLADFLGGETRHPKPADRGQVNEGTIAPKPPDAPVVRAPKLARMADCTVEEGTAIRYTVRLLDPGTVGPTLRFSLGPDAPPGAAIHPITGVFNWRPSREQTPGEYSVTIRAMVEGSATLGDQTTFRVSVRKNVKPPVIQPIAERTLRAGSTTRFPIAVTNLAGPFEKVVFSLSDAPPWMSIDPTTGIITCDPDRTVSPKKYFAIVRAANRNEKSLQDEQTIAIIVLAPMIVPGPPKILRYSQPSAFSIQLPSGATLNSAEVCILNQVRREISALKSQCHEHAPDVIALYQEGSRSVLAALSNVKGTKLHGATVLFYPQSTSRPKQYFTYRNGTLHGPVATWDEAGRQQLWCNYLSGRREGLCCFFENDLPAVVLECTRNKISSVHFITGNEIVKSFTAVEDAMRDDEVGPMLQEIDKLEQRVKADDRAYRDRVRQAIQLEIGFRNQQKRDAIQARRRATRQGTGGIVSTVAEERGPLIYVFVA